MNNKKFIFYSLGCLLFALFPISANFDIENNKQNHCYSFLSPISENPDGSSHIIETACFDTFAQAINEATNGRVHLDSSIRPEDVTDKMLNEIEGINTPLAQIVIGIDWDYINYGGSSYTWVVSTSGCTDTIRYSVSTMPSGWNDRVSSSKAYSNCSFYHYSDSNFGGSSAVCNPNCSTLGTLDNATSSERWIKAP